MTKSTSKKSATDTAEKAGTAPSKKRSRVIKLVTENPEASELNSTAAKAANRKSSAVKRSPAKKKKAPLKKSKKTTTQNKELKSGNIIKKVKGKIASAGHALADKIRTDKKVSSDS